MPVVECDHGVIGEHEAGADVRSGQKSAGESNRGQHNQSIEPSRPTKAALAASLSLLLVYAKFLIDHWRFGGRRGE
jgi:hypothetical protein